MNNIFIYINSKCKMNRNEHRVNQISLMLKFMLATLSHASQRTRERRMFYVLLGNQIYGYLRWILVTRWHLTVVAVLTVASVTIFLLLVDFKLSMSLSHVEIHWYQRSKNS